MKKIKKGLILIVMFLLVLGTGLLACRTTSGTQSGSESTYPCLHQVVIDAGREATCSETGLTEGSHCELCGEILVEQTEISTLAHTEVIDKGIEPTCGESGLTEGKHCEVCGEIIVEQREIPATGKHILGGVAVGEAIEADRFVELGGVESEPAICGTKGKGYFECEHCGNTAYIATVSKSRHVEVIDQAVEATCGKSGLTEGKHCEVCGEIIVEQQEMPANGKHILGGVAVGEVIDADKFVELGGEEIEQATCTIDGKGYFECEYCGDIGYVVTTGESRHVEVIDDAVESTCTTAGLTEGSHCDLCGEVLVEQEIVDALDHNFVNGKCTRCGANEGGNTDKVEIVDGYIYFGEYPQTIKADSVSITSTTNEKGYFLGSDGAWYAGVTATPNSSSYKFSNNASVTSGTTYYFKVEPIKWQVLSTDGATAKVVCASIIANRKYDDSINNYAQSEIRAWLNNEFYNQAFSDLQKELIVTTLVDNSAQSTGNSSNQYACEDTNDKIYLLSYAEAYAMDRTTSASEARERLTSDYSRATGVWMSTRTSYYGNGYWWIRSPLYTNDNIAISVNEGGDLDYYGTVSDTRNGVVPALQIRLTKEENTEKVEIVDGYIYFGEYPQTIKEDSVSITSTTNEKGYFLGSDGAWYAGVTATPCESSYAFSNNVSVESGTTYYFKVEPIKWQVLSTDGVTAKVVCASIIANHRFDDDSNNYAQSEIRAWLNNEFYNQAFTSLQQELIVTTQVDNSVASTGQSSNQYACEDTNDKIYLLSYAEAYAMDSTTTGESEARERLTSDYSRATGVKIRIGTSYYGNGLWWLRSPYYNHSNYAYIINYDGYLHISFGVDYTHRGVVPALQIRL